MIVCNMSILQLDHTHTVVHGMKKAFSQLREIVIHILIGEVATDKDTMNASILSNQALESSSRLLFSKVIVQTCKILAAVIL